MKLFIQTFRKNKTYQRKSILQLPRNDWQTRISFHITVFCAFIVCRDKTLRQYLCHLFSLLSYDYFKQIYYENKLYFSVFSVISFWNDIQRESYAAFILFLKYFVGSIQSTYFERCLVFLCFKPLEKFNFPIVIFSGHSFSYQLNKITCLWI